MPLWLVVLYKCMCAAAGQQSATQHGESCNFINSLNVQKHHISYFERRTSPPMPLRLSLRLDAALRSHGWSLLSAMMQPREAGIRNWFALREALCCLMGYTQDMLGKTYALKHTHTQPRWVKDIQEVSLMQELRILLSLIHAWRINNSIVVSPV